MTRVALLSLCTILLAAWSDPTGDMTTSQGAYAARWLRQGQHARPVKIRKELRR